MRKNRSIDNLPKPNATAPTKLFAAKVDEALLSAVKAEQLQRGLTFRQVLEWSLSAFLQQAAPAKAGEMRLKG